MYVPWDRGSGGLPRAPRVRGNMRPIPEGLPVGVEGKEGAQFEQGEGRRWGGRRPPCRSEKCGQPEGDYGGGKEGGRNEGVEEGLVQGRDATWRYENAVRLIRCEDEVGLVAMWHEGNLTQNGRRPRTNSMCACRIRNLGRVEEGV